MTTTAEEVDATLVFYKPGSWSAIDQVHKPTGRGYWSRDSLEQIRAEYGPEVEIVTLAEATAAIEAAAISKPARCTQEDYERALEQLPPINFGLDEDVEVFQMSEMTVGRITGTFADVDGEFFCWRDVANAPRTELADKARDALSAISGPAVIPEEPTLVDSPAGRPPSGAPSAPRL